MLLVTFAATLIPRAVALGQPQCPGAPTPEQFAAMVRSADLVVVGTVLRSEPDRQISDRSTLWLKPEAFLKGKASAAELTFVAGLPSPCAATGVRTGDRVLLLASGEGGPRPMPEPERVYRLADGVARSLGRGDTTETLESDLVARVRSITNQYVVPAASSDEGAGIDWKGTIVPVGAALLVIFAISLILMRIWHRIDPS